MTLHAIMEIPDLPLKALSDQVWMRYVIVSLNVHFHLQFPSPKYEQMHWEKTKTPKHRRKNRKIIFFNHHVKQNKQTLLKGTVNGISSHPPFPQIHAGFTIEILKLLSQGKQWCPCFFRFEFLQHRKKKTTEFNTLKNYDFFSFLLEKRWKEQVYV